MTPITHNKQVLCKNCIWGTRKDTKPTKDDVVFCEVWQYSYSTQYYCCEGMFPVETNKQLHILSFKEAMEHLP